MRNIVLTCIFPSGGIITPAMLEHFGYVRKNEYSSTPFQVHWPLESIIDRY